MQKIELKAAFSIAALFNLRLLGLFIILPIFTPYAHHLRGATPFLIGTALGIYGLTQALFQLPLGILSDYYPRKFIIAAGFLIFIIGSLICAYSNSINNLIIGRLLQGAGAVGSTLTALLTDLVQPENRSKSMAILGITVAFSFFMAMILGPVLNEYISVGRIFLLAAVLGICAVLLLFTIVPSMPDNLSTRSSELCELNLKNKTALFKMLITLLTQPQLLSLDIGIFFLHFILTATFIVIPLWIPHWTTYILPLLISFILVFGIIGLAEKNKKVFRLYFYSIMILILAELFLAYFHGYSPLLLSIGLTLFFLSFNLLEANLPSLISRISPIDTKGTAIGIYSSFQFLGIFCGGLFGGAVYQYFSEAAILLCCGFIAAIWLILTLIIRYLRRESWQEV